MSPDGKTAVRRAFEKASGGQFTVRDEYVAARVETLYDPFTMDDLDAGPLALDLVRRAYIQGLKQSVKPEAQSRTDCAQREAAYTVQLMTMFDRQADPEWVSQADRLHVETSIRTAFRAGCDEGRLPIGAVL